MSTVAVYDCMLFFRAAAHPERAYRTFDLVDADEVVLCMSAEVLAEIRDVLNRPEHRARFPELTSDAVDAVLNRQLRRARWFRQVPAVYELQRDPKDSKYVNLALAAGSEYLVTWDRDLLELASLDSAVGREFQRQFPALRVVDPIEFLRRIGRPETMK